MSFSSGGVDHLDIGLVEQIPVPPPTDGMTVYWQNDLPVGHHLRATLNGRIIEKKTLERLPSARAEILQELPNLSVSVVICSRDRPEELARCLASFADQTVTPREIIVVDNASQGERTREAADTAGVVYVREGRPGLDFARNTGARAATSDLVFYTDDDVVLHPRWLERLVLAFDSPDIMSVTGLVLPAELVTESQFHFEVFWGFGRGYSRKDFDKALFDAHRDKPFPAWEVGAGASMAFRREVFEKIGFFDERLDVGQAGCSGDSEFWYRILANGYTCRYEPAAVAYHYHRKTMKGLAHQIYHYMRGHSAALLVQNERTAIRQNLRRAAWTLPYWYFKRFLRQFVCGPLPSDHFLKEEALGFASGLLFYGRRRRDRESGRPCYRTSVIVPARNAAKTLRRSLDCLVRQTDGNWQAIIVDDQSTDETKPILAEYAARDDRFRILSGLGQGVSAARNVALGEARGQRILFLDADDWVDPDFLERMNGELDRNPDAVAVYCGSRRVMPDGSVTPISSDPTVALAPLEAFARRCAVVIHAVVLDREIALKVGSFDTSLRTCEDWDFWQRVSRLGGKWVHLDRAMCYYQMTPNSLTQDVSQLRADAHVVIARGFAKDPRISGVPTSLANGAVPGDQGGPESSYGYFSLWCSAFDAGRRLPAAIEQQILPALTPVTPRANHIAKCILDGFMVGSQSDIHGIADNWNGCSPLFNELLDAVSASDDPTTGVRRTLQYALELLLLGYDPLNEERRLDVTLGLQVNLRSPPTTMPSQGIDRLHVRLLAGKRVLKVLDLGIVGPILPSDWIDIASNELSDKHLLRIATLATFRLWMIRKVFDVADALAQLAGRGSGRVVQFQKWVHKPRRGSHAEIIRGLLTSTDGTASAKARMTQSTYRASNAPRRTQHSNRELFFESVFEGADPWNYGSPYEQEKYRCQIDLLPSGVHGAGLELACAEGHFTQMVAPRFSSFLATDISETALARARGRCARLQQVSFKKLDLANGPLPAELDVIFCSEVLYYLRNEDELAHVASRLAEALRPGGCIITAHAYLLKDSPHRTGFDWDLPYGASTISRKFIETRGLALERSIETDLYRVDRYRRIEQETLPKEPKLEKRPINATLDPKVARHIVRGGATARRTDLIKTKRPHRIPVLMYHSIAANGPAALTRYRTTPIDFELQLRWLRQNGYHAIDSEELLWFMENKHPFYGRPVLITFDDALQDFAESAWPLLRGHDLFAEVFVVSDLIGGCARWDEKYGAPAPLMSSDTIVRLHAEGVRFGSHLASHSSATGLATMDLIDELRRSRSVVSRLLGRPVNSMAAPYGRSDGRLRRLAREAGFKACFGGREGFASLTSDSLDLPRIEIQGEWSLSQFKDAIEERTGDV